MDKIYKDAKDLNVGSFIVYANTENNKLYKDDDLTVEVPVAIAADAFKKNKLLVVAGDVCYLAVKLEDNKVTVIDVESSVVTAKVFTAAE